MPIFVFGIRFFRFSFFIPCARAFFLSCDDTHYQCAMCDDDDVRIWNDAAIYLLWTNQQFYGGIRVCVYMLYGHMRRTKYITERWRRRQATAATTPEIKLCVCRAFPVQRHSAMLRCWPTHHKERLMTFFAWQRHLFGDSSTMSAFGCCCCCCCRHRRHRAVIGLRWLRFAVECSFTIREMKNIKYSLHRYDLFIVNFRSGGFKV